MQTPRLYRVILPVPDIERAVAFYGAVFGTPGQRISPGRHYFNCGGTILACYDPLADGDGESGDWCFHPYHLYFAVSDLETTLDRVQTAGGTIDAGIEMMPWGERLFYARDPFGSRICFVDERTLFTGQGKTGQDRVIVTLNGASFQNYFGALCGLAVQSRFPDDYALATP